MLRRFSGLGQSFSRAQATGAGLALAVAGACSHAGPLQEPTPDTRIENVTVIDAVGGEQRGMDVAILAGKILTVSAHETQDPATDAARIDGTGKYLIPGLWDAHVHLTYTEGLDHTSFFPLSIAHGVTSLRDTGGHLDKLAPARAAAAAGPLAPDLYVSGPLIDGALRVYAGQTEFNPDISVGADTPEDAVRIVDALADAGVDFIKAYEMLSEDTFNALIARADERGLPVAAHAPLSITAAEAALAGTDDMQHLRNLEFSCVPDAGKLRAERRDMIAENDAPHPAALRRNIHIAQRASTIAALDETSCDDLIALLADNKVSQTPTLTISRIRSHGIYGDEAYRKSFALVPAQIAKGWEERSLRFATPSTDEAVLAYDGWLQSIIPRLAAQDVPIMAGTDAPIGFLTPGASLHQELFLLVQAGLTPMEAIEAATLAPATFFGLQDEMGTIAAGMTADLVLLAANPLDDIRGIAEIEMVLKDGQVIDRAALDALLATNSVDED